MKKILIIDDSIFSKNMIKNIIKKERNDIEYFDANDGITAIEKYFNIKPDLTILDITIPELNGLDVLKNIINKDSEANIIMCSAINSLSTISIALEIGCKSFIVKPYSFEYLISEINKFL